MSLSPIVLFTYNRPWHTRQTIEALQRNKLAHDSELFIYSDAPKNESVIDQVNAVREYIKTIDGFKNITIREREKNWGLADSIIDGVTETINKHGKVIVLEDDIVTGPYFLKFINKALDFYEDKKNVWHISGWNYPIETNGLGDVFFWRLMNCWGWATWADRWQYYEKDAEKLVLEFTQDDIKIFNLDTVNLLWHQVLMNKKGKMNTWAVFWYATIFKKSGLCLNPSQTLVKNIGQDDSGVHSKIGFDAFSKSVISMKEEIHLDVPIKENDLAVKRIMKFYRSQRKYLLIKVIKAIRKMGIKNFINEYVFNR